MIEQSNYAIDVENLVKRFNDFTAVENINFKVRKGEIFAFLGPNGAGKSTTIKMLTTMLHPTSGTIKINGFDPMTEQDNVRRSFGIVFQDPSLDDELTAYENMELHAVLYKIPKEKIKNRVEELMTLVELWDKKDHFVKTFSGGMKRRLEIARGLLHHPKIIFLDEPTLGLDPQTRNSMWDYLKKMNKDEGITVFFTTHYMEEAARIANRIAIIDHGKIVTIGTVEDLEKKTGTKNLEDAFLKLTGSAMREEEATIGDRNRAHHKMWSKR